MFNMGCECFEMCFLQVGKRADPLEQEEGAEGQRRPQPSSGFLKSWGFLLPLLPVAFPQGRGNDLLVECNCLHASDLFGTKNGGEGNKSHRLRVRSAFSKPWDFPCPMTCPLPRPLQSPSERQPASYPVVPTIVGFALLFDCDSKRLELASL